MTRGGRTSGPIVVGVDGSAPALRAVGWAAAEAARRHLPLRLVTAFPWPPGDGPGERHREAERAAACYALEAAAGAVPAGLLVTSELRAGGPIGVLADEAAAATMVVVGDRGLSALDATLAGSVPVALAAHGAGPVVVVRGAERDDDAPVVVGVGGSADPAPALRAAFETAAARGAPVVAVRAWTDHHLADEVPEWVEAQRRVLDSALAHSRAAWPDVAVAERVRRGRAASVLLAAGQGAALIVVGSRGRNEVVGLLLGSVGNVLVHRAPCPVMLTGRHAPGSTSAGTRPTGAASAG